ncbi:MAG TPA: helix-turn-helix transcriptional regulator [Chitinophagaceae bacterium]|nr:helix-turn-helix transcriptional regulator [Chitinophagaceae bacterium]
MTFGQRVTIVRKQKNLTQTELAAQIGTSGNIVSKYERDFITPSIEVAAKIAEVLGTSIDYLVTGALPEGGAVSSEERIQLQQFDQLSPEDKLHVLAVVEAFVTKSKLQSVLARPSWTKK